MIKPNGNDFPVCMMCSLLSVSRSGYYAWKHRQPSGREQSGRLLAAEIKRVFDDEKGRAGAPMIARRLEDEGKSAGRHRVAGIMRDNGWRAKAARKYLDALWVQGDHQQQAFLAGCAQPPGAEFYGGQA